MRLLALTFLAAALCGCGGTATTPTQPTGPVPPTPGLVAFLGDSITARWAPLPVAGAINAGISGQTSEQVAARMQHDVIDQGAETVVILAGTNDILLTPTATIDYIKSMALLARDAGLRVILCTIPPTDQGIPDAEESENRVRDFNADIRFFASENAFEMADYFNALAPDYPADTVDHIHPNPAGYALMLEALNAATDPVPLGAVN